MNLIRSKPSYAHGALFSTSLLYRRKFIAENCKELAHLPIWFIHGRADLVQVQCSTTVSRAA